jgi:cysteine desulfuration protein SufE
MTIPEIQRSIVEDFSFFDEWEDKYRYIIDQGKELAPMAPEHRTEDYKVLGCQSQVWLYPLQREGRLHFEGDSDAAIVKGLVALVLRVYSGQKPEDIVKEPLFFIDEIGLGSHLSPTRSNGLASMVKQVRNYAVAISSQ